MKLIKTILLTSAFLVSSCAFALSSPAEIAAMMDEGKYNQAEVALKEVEGVKNTAKVHYMLAQTYQRMGKLDLAKHEITTAAEMDPGHSYTDDAHFNNVLNSIAQRPVAVGNGGNTSVNSSSDSSGFFKIVLGLVALVIAIWISWAVWNVISQSRKKKQYVIDAINTANLKASSLVQAVNNALLREKTAATPDDRKIAAIQLIDTKALNVFERIKNQTADNLEEITDMIGECIDLRSALDDVVNGATTKPYVDSQQTTQPSRAYVNGYRTRADKPVAPPPPPPVPAAPQTIVVNNSSPLTDVLIAETLINSDRDRREGGYSDRSRDNDDTPSRSSDSGSSSDWGSSSSDSGSSSDWGSSSSDSGSSSSWD